MLINASVFLFTLFGLSTATGFNASNAISMLADGKKLSVIGAQESSIWPVFTSTPAYNYGKDQFELVFNRHVIAKPVVKREGHSNLYEIHFEKLKDGVKGFSFVKQELKYKEGFSFVKCKRTIKKPEFTGEILMMVKGKLKDKTCKKVDSVKKGKHE